MEMSTTISTNADQENHVALAEKFSPFARSNGLCEATLSSGESVPPCNNVHGQCGQSSCQRGTNDEGLSTSGSEITK